MSNTYPTLVTEAVAVDYDYETGEAFTEAHWFVRYGADLATGEAHSFDCGRSFDAAKSVLQEATALHRAGRTLFACSWLVPFATEDGPSARDCGAPAAADGDERGWSCMRGHGHRFDAEYFDDDEIEGARQAGRMLPANARRMDGRPV